MSDSKSTPGGLVTVHRLIGLSLVHPPLDDKSTFCLVHGSTGDQVKSRPLAGGVVPLDSMTVNFWVTLNFLALAPPPQDWVRVIEYVPALSKFTSFFGSYGRLSVSPLNAHSETTGLAVGHDKDLLGLRSTASPTFTAVLGRLQSALPSWGPAGSVGVRSRVDVCIDESMLLALRQICSTTKVYFWATSSSVTRIFVKAGPPAFLTPLTDHEKIGPVQSTVGQLILATVNMADLFISGGSGKMVICGAAETADALNRKATKTNIESRRLLMSRAIIDFY